MPETHSLNVYRLSCVLPHNGRLATTIGDVAPVEESWKRTVASLPVPPAPFPPTDLDAVERVLDRPLPADLAEWWRVGGRVEHLIPPEHTPLSAAAALEIRRDRLDEHLRRGESIVDGEAGDPSRGFQSAFVPIAGDSAGRLLFVDLRGGPLHGCVGEWDDGFVDVVHWPSVAEMLGDVADALVHGVPAMTFHAAGRLRHFAGHPEVPVLTYRATMTPAGRLAWAT